MSTPARVLVIVAHPDDETFGCGSLLLHAAKRGAHTTVLCATRGEAGGLAPGVEAPNGIAELREAELRTAAEVLGVGTVELLDFVDSGMNGEPAPDSLCGTSIDALTETVRVAIDRHRPDLVITLDGGDGHRDHLRLREVVESILSGTDTALYLHCLPRSLMHAWVRHNSGLEGAAAYTGLPEIGTPDEHLTTIIDTAAHLPERDAAITVHRSQRSPFEGLPEELRRAFLTREHLIRVNPAWTGTETANELAWPT